MIRSGTDEAWFAMVEFGATTPTGYPTQQRSIFQMSFKTTVARRFARVPVLVAAAGAVLAGIGVAAGPALADTPQYTGVVVLGNQSATDPSNFDHMCLDANSSQAQNFGQIMQWDCNIFDAYQKWALVYAGNGWYQLKNQGTGFCADADADNAGTYGSIIQWTCSSADPFQLFSISDTGGGALSIESLGASQKTGTPLCLDADFYTQKDFGGIIQYPCNTSDSYQLWSFRTTVK